MPYMIAKSAGRCGILVVLLAMHTGCASPNRQARRTALPEVRALQSGRVENELKEELLQFVDYAESEIGAVADQIEAGTQDVEVKKAALLWKVEFTQATTKRSMQKKSMALLMDAWAALIRQTKYLQSGEGKNLFGDQQSSGIKAAVEHREGRAILTERPLHVSVKSAGRPGPKHGGYERTHHASAQPNPRVRHQFVQRQQKEPRGDERCRGADHRSRKVTETDGLRPGEELGL